MTMLQQHGVLSATTDPLIQADKTKTFNVTQTIDDNHYYLNCLMHQNPRNKNIIIRTYAYGVNHVADLATPKKLCYDISTDKGASFGSRTDLHVPPAGWQVQDPSAGMDRGGRIHFMLDEHTSVGTPGGSHRLWYRYSDDNCATISTAASVTLPSISGFSGAFRMYGRIIDTRGGVLIAPAYFAKDEGDASQSNRGIFRSTDHGANWTWISFEGTTTEYISETEVINITPNVLFAMSRYEPAKVNFMMYKSTDAGLTWTRVGIFPTTISITTAAPCRLHRFRSNLGRPWVVMYFPDKDADKLYAVYGRVDNGVDAGIGLFNINTLTVLRTDTSILHYGDMCHYNNNFNALGLWAKELGTFPTDNQMIYFENMSTHYDAVSQLIEPITIYDKLAQLSFVAEWNGLVANTTNNWGIVNASNQITTLKSIAPGPTNQPFTATAGGIVLDSAGMTFDGTKALSHATSTYWNFMSYSSLGESDVNYTIWLKLKIGTSSNPNAFYGILGNSAGSASNKGMYMAYDDRAAVPASDRLALQISKGTAGFIVTFQNDNVITPNAFHVIQIRVDLNESVTSDKVKLEVDGTPISTTVSAYNTGVAANPTFNMQIGNMGNNTAGGFFVGTIKKIIIQNLIDLSSVRSNFTQALIDSL